LIPVLLFVSLLGVVEVAKLDYLGHGILFSDLNNNDYFFDNYIPNAESWAQTLFWLQSESHIRDMGCLEWEAREYTEYTEYGELVHKDRVALVSKEGTNLWFTTEDIPADEIDSPKAARMVADAIGQQLNEFRYVKTQLEETPGLFYYVTDGTRRIGNVPKDSGAPFFRSHPVYSISESGKAHEWSRTGDTPSPYYYEDYQNNNDLSCYLAFSSEEVTRQNDVWKTAQHRLIRILLIIVIPALLALAFIIILMVGAGRKYGGEHNELKFTALDKPWLDLGFLILAVYEFSLCYAISEAAWSAWHYDNTQWMIILCAVLSVFFTLPLLGWIVSFTKHCKAGTWWRHTLFYKLIFGLFNMLRRFFKSLWSGFSLTFRAVLLGGFLFAINVLCVFTFSWEMGVILAMLFSALSVFLLLRYTRKLFLVEQGAKDASGGRYDSPIPVTGGELGSIAASINNISAGIHDAVMERLKSEQFKTELITNVSHDIRTPLTSLITYTDLLKNEGLDSERAPEYLEVLIQKSTRLKSLTDDLFEASKALSGNIEVHMEPLDLADFVRQVLGEMDEKVRDSGLDFRLHLPDHAPVQADGRLLWRVMENLLSNVFKYALSGSRVYLDVMPDGGFYRLDMKNISECPLNIEPSELIERFKRGDDARSGEGSGLGLSIAQSFILSQGGRFEISIDGDLFKASLSLYSPNP